VDAWRAELASVVEAAEDEGFVVLEDGEGVVRAGEGGVAVRTGVRIEGL
jgi:uncharacterized cupin superfamily protein